MRSYRRPTLLKSVKGSHLRAFIKKTTWNLKATNQFSANGKLKPMSLYCRTYDQIGGDTWSTCVRPSGSHLPFYVRRTLIGYTEKIQTWVDIFSLSGTDLTGQCCTLPAAREQAGQTASAEQAASSYAQVLANNRADLVNRNLTLSDENARLKDVINTLRQDNASLQQRLDGYEQRLQTLEKSMLGGTQADIAVSVPNTNTTSVGSAHNIGVHNTTSVGSTHNTTPVGDAHRPSISKANTASNTEAGGPASPRASVSPTQLNRIEGPRDAPSYIPKASQTPRPKVQLRRGPTFVPVTSPITKAAGIQKSRKGHMTKQPKL